MGFYRSIFTLYSKHSQLPQRYVLIRILFLVLLVAYLDRVNISILLADGDFLRDMQLTDKPVMMGLVMTVFLLPYALANVIFSPLGDIVGPRKIMVASIALWIPAMALGGMASTFAALLTARFLLGIGEGIHWPMQSKFVKNWFPRLERGKANAVWLSGLILGPAVALPLLAWLVQFGWRQSFYLLAALNLVPILLIWLLLTDKPRQHRRITPAEIAYIEQGGESEPAMAEGFPGLKASFRLFAGNTKFWLLTILSVCHASIWWGTISWLPSYLKTVQGFSWNGMSFAASLPYFLGTVAALAAGHFSDKFNRRAPFVALSIGGAALGILISILSSNNIVAAIAIALGITALGSGLPVIWAILQQMVPAPVAGAGAGLMNGLTNIGAALAPVIVGFLISWSGSFGGGLLYLVGAGFVGLLCVVPLWRGGY
ncbi:MAG: MFS transporter [Negativicutes bacterium]|nr:MFS transporter [Negativicutes bacterium]